jgi:5-deoxy-glucuronate isomerase
MKRHYRPHLGELVLHDIRSETAGWKYLSFKVIALQAGQKVDGNSGSEEIVIVPLVGQVRITFRQETHEVGRNDVFRELTGIVYLPPGTGYSLTGISEVEVAIGGAPATGKLPARLIPRRDIPSAIRGGANVQRGVSTLLDSDELSERLTVYEIRTPSGNWSSFPPHRHDTRDNSSYHEETYYYRLTPPDGFAIQRIYTRDTDLDVAIPLQDGDLVLVHEGYHPVVKAPGTNAYYLNFLAGDVRKINAVNDPHYDWVSKQWDGHPLEIPVKAIP